jgi:hypothetical protein
MSELERRGEPFDSKYELFKQTGVPFSGMNCEYDKLEQYDPMTLIEVLEKVRQGCQCHMYRLDEQGCCSESDDYVVALAFFEDYIEKIKEEEADESSREGEWNPDPHDHIEERERDEMLGQDEEENA